ncbi:hypothetical protein ORI20_03045 [Mycobacterium sp. CVI_P3]|uniref:Uncharacterized protein n=1 Tax=Mycobacterium pinniadriaticum TaxID=2994102 RepID=A0ABT3S9V8_9MYCO|nr:hypothetical protein [Mycobacterium pinniadriaticum]MCX2929237.1 hypothetical protein [Mycobacterium pinniadriaticum]MCX2935662.1 hypothetical protein [Mycobacterium pinniadriaticum]
MSRRWWWTGSAVIVVVAVAVGAWFLLGRRHSDDSCAAVRDMIAVNRQHSAQVGAQADNGVQPTQDEYEQWADRLGELASTVDDETLAPHARRMADLAHQSAALNPAILAELSAPQPSPGPAATKYAALNQQFVAEQTELAHACPA